VFDLSLATGLRAWGHAVAVEAGIRGASVLCELSVDEGMGRYLADLFAQDIRQPCANCHTCVKALDALTRKAPSGGYDTNHETDGMPSSYVAEKNGGDDGTRTRDLYRDSLGIHVLSATYILAGAAKSLKGTLGTVHCG